MTSQATNISIGDYKKSQQNKKNWLLLVALVLYFSLLALMQKTNVLNDSGQYIAMHIHREPLYSLFLWVFRSLFGGNELYLELVTIIQGILAAYSIWYLAEVIREQFTLKNWEEIIISLIGVFPFLLTRFFSATHIDMSNSIMSEALCLPLFYLYIASLFQMCYKARKVDYGKALALALLLSLTRGQMLPMILVWFLVASYRTLLREEKLGIRMKRIVCLVVLVTVTFASRTILVKSYNLVFNNHFINNTYGNVSLFTNVLYASDKEDIQYITDESNRVFFEQMMAQAYENEATHLFYGTSLSERADGVEESHDYLKFQCIENVLYEYYDNHITTDYIEQNIMEDQVSMELMKNLLPHVWKEWLMNYIAVVYRGLIRSVAVVHPFINWVVLLVLGISVVIAIIGLIRNPSDMTMLTMMIGLLLIAANAFACAITIMCLSRYMIYGFAGFYIAWYVNIRNVWISKKSRIYNK